MIFLDKSLDSFFEEHPSLKELAEEECKEHNLNISHAKPYMTSKTIGIILDPHTDSAHSVFFFKKHREELNSYT